MGSYCYQNPASTDYTNNYNCSTNYSTSPVSPTTYSLNMDPEENITFAWESKNQNYFFVTFLNQATWFYDIN